MLARTRNRYIALSFTGGDSVVRREGKVELFLASSRTDFIGVM